MAWRRKVPSSATSLLDTVLAADTERAALMAEAPAKPQAALHRIAEIQARLTDSDAWSAEARASVLILKGLGFDRDDQRRPCSPDFSGGWRAIQIRRVALAGVLKKG